MKKVFMGIALSSCSALAFSTEVLHGALSGVSGAGYATGDFSEGVLLNPSLLASGSPTKGGFSAMLGFGVAASDADDLITQADDLADLTDLISNTNSMTTSQASDLKLRLKDIDDDSANINAGANFVLAFASKENISAALVVNAFTQAALTPKVADGDLVLIDSFVNKQWDPSNSATGLKSTVNVRGAALGEVGIALAKSFAIDDASRFQLGITPKRVSVETFVYNTSVADYEDDGWDADEYRTSKSAMNFDIGALYVRDKYRVGLTAKNLKNQEYKTILPNENIEVKRQLNASAGYVNGALTTEVALDLNAIPTLGGFGDTQYLRAGVSYTVLKFVHLRAGLQQDLKNTQPDSFSVGLGLGSVLNLSYISGGEKTQGFALSGGFRF